MFVGHVECYPKKLGRKEEKVIYIITLPVCLDNAGYKKRANTDSARVGSPHHDLIPVLGLSKIEPKPKT